MDYSYLKASIGFSLAALRAGYIPKKRPTTVENVIASIIGKAEICVVSIVNLFKTKETITAKMIPNIPPVILKTTLSIKN